MAHATGKIDSRTQSVGEFLRKPSFYQVPVYQRDFAWTSEEIDVLWEDIIGALEDGREEYFLGAIVVSHSDDENVLEIVDGQQRLAAISMVFDAIVRQWNDNLNDKERAQDVSRDYLGTKDRRTGEISPKLTLNEINDNIYQAVIAREERFTATEKKVWQHSNKLLYEAFENIQAKLTTWVNQQEDTESALVELEEFIERKINFIVIEVADDSDAFIIFETLNDRGLELAVSDLVKNYLFSKAEDKIDRFKNMWTEISSLIGSDNMTQFLRHFWLSEHALVRERDLYRALRSTIKSHTKARQFLERLKKAANFYSAMLNPDHSYWEDFSSDARTHLEALRLFKVTQYRPVALAVMEKAKPDVVRQVLHMLAVISFRYTVISSLGTGNLEKIYSDSALAIRNGKVKKPRQILDTLKSAYVDDKRFSLDFRQKRFTKASIARYVLAGLNDRIANDSEMKTEQSGRVTLEHILPKKPNARWPKAIPNGEDIAQHVDLIGNLTLLEKGRNRGLGNAAFSEKRNKAYNKSSLAINHRIAKQQKWTHVEIKKRSIELAKVAKQIWRLDY